MQLSTVKAFALARNCEFFANTMSTRAYGWSSTAWARNIASACLLKMGRKEVALVIGIENASKAHSKEGRAGGPPTTVGCPIHARSLRMGGVVCI
jgi:hypothetical protein